MNQVKQVRAYFESFQQEVTRALEAEQDSEESFIYDCVSHDQGRNIAAVIEDASLFERAGVNFSYLSGQSLPDAATLRRPDLANAPFESTGVSMVIHPRNPFVPTMHANLRFFSATPKGKEPVCWFGGGFDLTPYYGFEEDAKHWHQMAKNACDPFDEDLYPEFKAHCDQYFYLPHRKEARGIGGIFFDDLNRWSFDRSFEFIQSIGHHLLLAYRPIVAKRKSMPYDETHRAFQSYRRGRYVEFNLIYDRGTAFGLQFGTRVDALLVSMPLNASWRFHRDEAFQKAEAELNTQFLQVKDWLGSDEHVPG
jgi:coproporphyrinogen III oxidase